MPQVLVKHGVLSFRVAAYCWMCVVGQLNALKLLLRTLALKGHVRATHFFLSHPR